jgi:predicted phage terminase large subunit-like protein
LLWEWKYNLEDIERLRTGEETSNIFSTQYLQKPVPLEGLLFPKETTKYYETLPENPDYILLNIDPADEGKDCLSSNVYLCKDKEVFVSDVIYTPENSDIAIPRIILQVKESKTNYVRIESNGGWSLYRKEIKRQLSELGSDCEARSFSQHKNKEIRIYNEAPTIRNRFLFNKNAIGEYAKAIHDMNYYQKMVKDQKDDFVDNLAAASQHLKKIGILDTI